jgi:hypothetical protein
MSAITSPSDSPFATNAQLKPTSTHKIFIRMDVQRRVDRLMIPRTPSGQRGGRRRRGGRMIQAPITRRRQRSRATWSAKRNPRGSPAPPYGPSYAIKTWDIRPQPISTMTALIKARVEQMTARSRVSAVDDPLTSDRWCDPSRSTIDASKRRTRSTTPRATSRRCIERRGRTVGEEGGPL